MTAPAEQLSHDAFFAALRAQMGDQHASWCTRPCAGECAGTETVDDRYRITATLPAGAVSPTLIVTDLASGDRMELTATAAQQIAGLVAAWAHPSSLPATGFRPTA